ncbi:hypothetical protein JCM8115_002035 [Rhodotorula mucilaginosa]|uniref:Cytoplasmic protein n=1 Tax=Rhodotorula mucilaginosa TaxID=5537 RepID=A0A9P6VYT2_RHOMI|nr:hypothetical protein C6P46_005370 [Rhodotorula mucilaginosa]
MRSRSVLAWSLPLAWSAICLASPTTATTSALDRVIAEKRTPSIAWPNVQRLSPRHGGHHDEDDSATDGESQAMMSMSAPRPESTTLAATANSHGDSSDEEQQQQHGSPGHIGADKDAHEPPRSSGHDHGHSHGPALLELNETQILLTHSPDPPSYWDYDQSDEGRPAVLYAHIALMTLSFFGLLPLAIFLKAGRSSLYIIPQAAFLAVSFLGLVCGQVYNGLTPNMYEHSSHTSWGWFTMVLAFALNIVDVGKFCLRFTRWGKKKSEGAATGRSVSPIEVESGAQETTPFRLGGENDDGSDEVDRLVGSPVPLEHPASPTFARGNSIALSDGDTAVHSDEVYWHGESTAPPSAGQRVRKWTSLVLAAAERSLILLAYIQVCSGIAVWTGSCRENYLNGCLAHIIKGSIFLWYGLLTFARYCGAFSSLGWAWNRHPSKTASIWTAEFVESLVIFTYGATNTWMERMGKTGSYSVKDVQHISIAIMFWGAGALGMFLESRTVRAWLSTPAAETSGRSLNAIPPPPSAAFSFNPFPALCIGVTGVAMAAHHQTYQFQVDIHALWGNLLGAFAGFRFLTYFFLFLRPPSSILPSRPPTEALASLALTCGGVVFILSVEQVTFAAMRHHADDVMAFLNLTVAAVCAWFFWTACLFAIKGWALSRTARATSSSLRAKLYTP